MPATPRAAARRSLALLTALVIFKAVALADPAATLYSGGPILTLAGKGPADSRAEALVAGGDGRIKYVGSLKGAEAAAGPGATRVDLAGRTLMPGLIDSHGHMLIYAHNSLNADLRDVKDIPELLGRLGKHAPNVPKGGWIEGQGYAPSLLKEQRHPTKEELDTVSTTVPMFIQDSSGHHGVVNSLMLKNLNVTADTPDPPGGLYYRKPGSREPDGHLAENAAIALYAKRPPLTKEQIRRGVASAVQVWVSNGFTTGNELGLGIQGDDPDVAATIVEERLLPIDLVIYVKASVAGVAAAKTAEIKAQHMASNYSTAGAGPRYLNRVRAEGLKFWLDGSIPTALLSQPYATPPPGETRKDYKGVQVDPTAEVDTAIQRHWKNGTLQIAFHVLGDAAVEIVLQSMEKAAKEQGPTTKRHAIQHAAMIRPDQVKRIAALGALPSFTSGSVYLLGDYILETWGREREGWLMPARSFLDLGVPITINTDYPAGAGPSLFLSLHDIVNRATKDGELVVGAAQRITPFEGLKAMTANGAYLHNEEKVKGTLEPGKLADFVILDKDPLAIDPKDLINIKVLETIKEGKTVYKRPADAPAVKAPALDAEQAGHWLGTNETAAADGLHPVPYTGPVKLSAEQGAAVGQLLATAAGPRRLLA
ncbi:hypothetical protein Rsub_03355 [Raphidocelis subcapitata]|uniref:Amidohydrolase 3 domain-containing protein n=1 Tax=Raphidocelis subcapitata TaxID=307507 RepID=A0A2V0NU70_9CHLO|nr:hypothetical protein Rsub_03355 [Raphidocelis subcapitata]|eukprot:GBF90222.1 hypothetical protein Rsub_03355 [Raphidocelis subcapitata]